MIRFNMPKLRIYQQILICFGLMVSLPLLGVTFLINNINQKAMKKEMARFTEHTAEALYRDFDTEMSWQKQQTRMLSRIMSDNLAEGDRFDAAATQVLSLDDNLDVVGLYNQQGELLQAHYRNFQRLSPELRLPDTLPPPRPNVIDPKPQASPQTAVAPDADPASSKFRPFEVIYFETGNPQDSPYYLRAVIPVRLHNQAAYYVQQKSFGYLQNLVRSNNSLYGAFYIVDSDGLIIAGPSGANQQERISEKDYTQFIKIRPGVTHEFSSKPQAAAQESQKQAKSNGDDDDKDSEEAPALEKVIVKMPEINWGIIIESPYHMKQKYIKRAGTQTLLLILGCLAVILLSVLPYILGISRNFRQLIKGVKAMGDGNYFRRIRLITNYFTPYEIVYLTLEFNRMARKTADSWQTIQDANRKLAQMDEFKSNLIDTVSHEFRTPLTIIKGNASRLLRYDASLDSDTRLRNLKAVKQQADRLSRLVEDLLVIPDLEKANLRVYPDRVELLPLLENCVLFIQSKEQRDIRVYQAEHIDETHAVLADPDRLEQILLNLLDNAVKYSPEGSPIDVALADANPETASTPLISITVSNQCDPTPMEELPELDKLFEKFTRLDDSLIRTTRGSGLGLFITRGLVEAMGGSIELGYNTGQFEACFTVPVYQENSLSETDRALA